MDKFQIVMSDYPTGEAKHIKNQMILEFNGIKGETDIHPLHTRTIFALAPGSIKSYSR